MGQTYKVNIQGLKEDRAELVRYRKDYTDMTQHVEKAIAHMRSGFDEYYLNKYDTDMTNVLAQTRKLERYIDHAIKVVDECIEKNTDVDSTLKKRADELKHPLVAAITGAANKVQDAAQQVIQHAKEEEARKEAERIEREKRQAMQNWIGNHADGQSHEWEWSGDYYGYTCYGYANWICNKLYGGKFSAYKYPNRMFEFYEGDSYYQLGSFSRQDGNLSVENIQSLFSNAKPGDVIQMVYNYGGMTPHTMIFNGFTEHGISVLQGNYEGKYGNITEFTYDELFTKINNEGTWSYDGSYLSGGISLNRATNYDDIAAKLSSQ